MFCTFSHNPWRSPHHVLGVVGRSGSSRCSFCVFPNLRIKSLTETNQRPFYLDILLEFSWMETSCFLSVKQHSDKKTGFQMKSGFSFGSPSIFTFQVCPSFVSDLIQLLFQSYILNFIHLNISVNHFEYLND